MQKHPRLLSFRIFRVDEAIFHEQLITLSTQFYSTIVKMLSGYLENSKNFEKLRQDLADMRQAMLSKYGIQSESRFLIEVIDNVAKKFVARIWDDLYAIKKSLKAGECPTIDLGTSILKIEDRVNYASDDLGAIIVSVDAKPVCPPNFLKSLLGMDFAANPPIQMLKSNMEPGNCFAFRNDSAIVTIKLSQPVLIDQIGLEHISNKQTPGGDTSAAPKDFAVFAVTESRSVLLGKFRYDRLPTKLRQTFWVHSTEKYDTLRFHFNSNHGHPKYTCVYRIIVHGKIAIATIIAACINRSNRPGTHISNKQTPGEDTSAAPKDFAVFAVTESRGVLLAYRTENFDYYTIVKNCLKRN
uniref:SUN domain-containing protein n=1 Tax=Glossina brevipalpis TaxID=37001 RepID=A0A1A9WTW5_9MUSC